MTFSLYFLDTKTGKKTPIASGGTFYRSTLGAGPYLIGFDFGSTTHGIKFQYSLNGVLAEEDSFPYILGGRKPVTLKDGANEISFAVDGGSWTTVAFTLLDAPPVAKPSGGIAGSVQWGTNLIGANYPADDFGLHPELPAAGKALGWTWYRDWLEEPTLAKAGDLYWTDQRAIQKAGFKTALQAQYPNKGMWSDYGKATLERAVAGKAINAYLLGNEVNTRHTKPDGSLDAENPGNYFLGTQAQLTQQCIVADPIGKAAGVTIVAQSRVNDLPGIESLYKAGAYGPLTSVDLHLYSDNENWLIGQIQQYNAFCASNELQGWVSEWNLRMLKGETLVQWGVRVQKVLQAFAATNLIVLHFSAVPTGHEDDTTATLDAKYQSLTLPIFQAVLNPASAK